MRRLYEFTRRLSGLATLDAVAEGAASELHASLGRPVVVLLARADDVALIAAWPPEDSLDAAAMTAARWAYSHVEPAGTDTGTLPIIPWYFVPLRTGTQTLGVVGVAKEKDAPPIDSEGRALLAPSWNRLRRLNASLVVTWSLQRRAELSAAHCWRLSRMTSNSLSSILGSATSLIDYGNQRDGEKDCWPNKRSRRPR